MNDRRCVVDEMPRDCDLPAQFLAGVGAVHRTSPCNDAGRRETKGDMLGLMQNHRFGAIDHQQTRDRTGGLHGSLQNVCIGIHELRPTAGQMKDAGAYRRDKTFRV
jgi:hypothetical protein